ncbi:MAG: flavodoxin-dependent (E)-4-hydroxy-3-methylbut-2-enyl-diphosphate synthase [Candidatus Omnitrophica bacterium]|nr:flavodoxin-dependent (E)-4-hydroxy-3-methylbut-2-enyl-diphosphate synthase [Candidatus Omnitrophota bacterium]
MEIQRRKSKVIKIGKVRIGGLNPIAIQSMTKTKTADVSKTVKQINQLEDAGCLIVRLAIKDFTDARALKEIKKNTNLPLVADIHFDWRLAIAAVENGADKIRLNPGNIDKDSQIKEVISALKYAGVPLRIGLNSGSVKEHGAKRTRMPERLVRSCLGYIRKIEKLKFDNIVISLKASNALDTIAAYRKISRVCNYPLHLGVTAAGSVYKGIIKSSIALGVLLSEGVGDTIRVSLTDDPLEEVRAAKCILESLGLINNNIQIISCPTCGRCEVNLVSVVKELEQKINSTLSLKTAGPLKVAVMGCVVNGPGEAKEADMGIAFGKSAGLFFNQGKMVRKIPFKDCVKVLLREIEKIK